MLVENDPGTAKIISWVLGQHSYAVKHISESIQALRVFKKNSEGFPVVIVNVRMPRMTGFEFARLIRRHRSDVRIILLTDFQINKSEFRRVFPSTQVDDIVVKPTAAPRLMQAVTGIAMSCGGSEPTDDVRVTEYQNAVG